ncbi:hypothetical protein [Amycolatopsis sp. Poz14]|uniref:hypothetical protein n=1 Tax=Amycolatopsis sp. Poz14 TaxID=1447705 RepID=UPI001EE97149|nr:hypothetical protein [Amycolatopsis sp. Poz14]MCG3757366.1 hypothetical protein [Amycolatopsis sp. Poz14]
MNAHDDDHRADGVTITNREIYDQVLQTKALTEKLVQKIEAIETRDLDHEARIRSLERKVWMALGGGTTLGGAAGALATFIIGG